MRYCLKPPYALRGWRKFPFLLCENGVHEPTRISAEDTAFLNACDGEHELPEDARAKAYLDSGVIVPAGECEAFHPWQKYQYYDNEYFGAVSFAPTLRCNYNCRHCFMAKDENKTVAQLSYDECLTVFDEMAQCGIGTIRYTGGEPFVHPRFLDLVLESHRRGIEVEEILTNGALLRQSHFDAFLREPPSQSSLGIQRVLRPLIMVSFDGLGMHDWLRGVEGAEREALAAMELTIQNGFRLSVHLCVHKGNVDGLWDTVQFLSDMGVSVIRIIRVSEAPRWLRTSADANISPEEYYEKLLALFRRYRESNLRPMLELWGLLRYFPMYDGRVEWLPEHTADARLLKMPLCSSIRGHFHISADRSVFPCNIMSGAMRAFGDDMPKIIETPLQEILQSSTYLTTVCRTFGDMRDAESPCYACEHLPDCQGGCRALAYATTRDYFGVDHMRCVLFKKGFAARFHVAAGE